MNLSWILWFFLSCCLWSEDNFMLFEFHHRSLLISPHLGELGPNTMNVVYEVIIDQWQHQLLCRVSGWIPSSSNISSVFRLISSNNPTTPSTDTRLSQIISVCFVSSTVHFILLRIISQSFIIGITLTSQSCKRDKLSMPNCPVHPCFFKL